MYPSQAKRLVLTLLFVASIPGCAGARSASNPFEGGQASTNQIVLSVENQNYNDVRLYVTSIRGRQSLGLVVGNSEETFRIDWPNMDALRIRMEFMGDETVETSSVTVGPGDQLELLITQNPRNSVLQRR